MSKPLADHGDAAQMRQQVAADRLEALALDVDVQPSRDLSHVHLPLKTKPALALVDDRLRLHVVLVADLADDLLQQVLDGRRPGRPAVFIHDDGALRLLALKLLQQLGYTLRLRHHDRRPDNRRDRDLRHHRHR